MEELKTCPFCGGDARLRPWVAPGRSEMDPFWVACCDDCGNMTWPYSGKEAAVMRWNRRVGQTGTEDAAPPKRCISCRYSTAVFGKLFCVGMPDKPEVRASDHCDAWKPEAEG